MSDIVKYIDLQTEKDAWNLDGLGGIDLLVVLTINTFADAETHRAHPSIARLARQSGLDQKTVRAALARLEKRGLVVVERHDRKPSTLTLRIPTTASFGTTASGSSYGSPTDDFGGSTTTKFPFDYSQKRQFTTTKSGTRTNRKEIFKTPEGEEWMNR